MGRFLPLPLPNWHSIEHLPDESNSSNSLLTYQSCFHSSSSSLTSGDGSASASASAQFRCLATLKGHSSYVFSLALSRDHLYSGSSDGEIRVWYRNNPDSDDFSYYCYVVGEGYSAVKSMLVWGDKLVTAHQDHKIRVWRIVDNCNTNCYRMIATLPTLNDRCLRVFSSKNYVQVRRHSKRTWVHHVDTVSCLALSPDAALLYSVSWDRTLKVWRTSDFKCVESVRNAHDDAVNAVVVSGDGGCVYTCSADRTIKAWKKLDGEKHSLVSTLEKHKSAVNALAIAGDGSVLFSGACDKSIIAWEKFDDGNWAPVGALKGHKKAILCLAVAGELVCSGSADQTVRIWRRGSTGKYDCLGVLEGHTGPVKCLTAAAFSEGEEDSKDCSYRVYSGSLDSEIRVWEIEVSF